MIKGQESVFTLVTDLNWIRAGTAQETYDFSRGGGAIARQGPS